ncbi:MAG: M15 family metallopeptidase, partial [Pseudomonadota bacterium]
AIDLNSSYGEYWRWQKDKSKGIRYNNRMPMEIVRIFENNGFIWGGRWYHYDTFHFEYRPEFREYERQQ